MPALLACLASLATIGCVLSRASRGKDDERSTRARTSVTPYRASAGAKRDTSNAESRRRASLSGGDPSIDPARARRSSTNVNPVPEDPLDAAVEQVSAVQLVGCPPLTSASQLEESYDSVGNVVPVAPACSTLKGALVRPAREEPFEPLGRENTPFLGLHACTTDATGVAWGVEVTAVSESNGRYVGKWRLVRSPPGGTLTRSDTFRFRQRVDNLDGENLPPTCLGFFDFNGNGQVEAITVHREGINNAAQERRVRIWTVDGGGQPVPFGPSAALVAFGMADFDADGRPDLAVNPYATSSREPTFPIDWTPRHSDPTWGLVARSLASGAFSTDSEVSRRAARRLCPIRPREELPANPSEWPGYLHCAKLWGRPTDTMNHQIRAACEASQDAETEHSCRYGGAFLRAIARGHLPISLADEGSSSATGK